MLVALSSLLIYFSVNMLSAPVLFIPTSCSTSPAFVFTNLNVLLGKYVLKGNTNKYFDIRQLEMTQLCSCCHQFEQR